MHIPDPETYPHDKSIPILVFIRLRGPSAASLAALRPILPWEAGADKAVSDGTRGPELRLQVYIDSHVEGNISTQKKKPLIWTRMGGFYRPDEKFFVKNPDWAGSQDWSEPLKVEGGDEGWTQTAAVISSFKSRYEKRKLECSTDLRLLKTRFELSLMHSAGDRMILIPLSTRPWTSGVYKEPSHSSGAPAASQATSVVSGASRDVAPLESRTVVTGDAPPPYITRASS